MSLFNFDPHTRRYRFTLKFLEGRIRKDQKILDLGSENDFSNILKKQGYTVINTDFDLDKYPDTILSYDCDVCTAFEIFEHLLNPLSVIEQIPGNRLFASVPLSLWFASSYRNKIDAWDRHFHEFEDWQFDWLLDHAGWEILRREKWTNPTLTPGIRSIFRLFTPRWYIIEAIRKNSTKHID